MIISGNIIDVISKKISREELTVIDGKIQRRKETRTCDPVYLLPGLIDAHVHIESSMLTPSAFAFQAVQHGTIATLSDPHEIANVLGIEGINFMITEGKKVPFKFFFGAPSCVPATPLESSGANLNAREILKLMKRKDIFFLSEMMNYPGVVMAEEEVMKKIRHAHKYRKPIDGHAPGLTGEALATYAQAGISTDHECSGYAEAREKISRGMKILIREGSAARNLDALWPLIKEFPDKVMLCTDDLHPDDLMQGHMNLLVRKVLDNGVSIMDVLAAACLNPVIHYRLPVGLLQEGDPADFICIDHPDSFRVLETYIDGRLVQKNGQPGFAIPEQKGITRMFPGLVTVEQLLVPAQGVQIRIIEAMDGELVTRSVVENAPLSGGQVVSDTSRDILKIVVRDRYSDRPPAVGFIRGFRLKEGAIASSIAHDNHHVIVVGTDDHWILETVNRVITSGGGICVSGTKGSSFLPLPVAGLMTLDSAADTAGKYQQLNRLVHEMGSPLRSPLMTLSFMALLVIPELKIGEKGLFDVSRFNFVPLFVD